MKNSLMKGLSFGLTSGTITTLGLMVGLAAGTKSRLAVIGGILTIAIADAMSDALGIHIAEEASNSASELEIWESTLATFFVKFGYAVTFLVPVLFLDLSWAVVVSAAWGLGVLSLLSYVIGKWQKTGPWRVVLEHLVIALAVIVITYFTGRWINGFFSA